MDNADILRERAGLIGHALRDVSENKLWRWRGYSKSEGLRVADYSDGGQSIGYRRVDDKKALLYLDNVRPIGVRDKLAPDPVPTGVARVDFATAQTIYNRSNVPIHKSYTATFHKVKTRQDSFNLSFSQSLTQSVSYGGDLYGVEGETSIEVGSTQETGTESSEETGETYETSFDVEVPAHTNLKVWATRKIQPMKAVITGQADIDHSVAIGKHWSGKWSKHSGYDRSGKWASMADFILTIKGEAPRDFDFWNVFRERPAPSWLIKRLEEPLNAPFRQDVEYDNVANEELHADELE